jgi:hypothetical protein
MDVNCGVFYGVVVAFLCKTDCAALVDFLWALVFLLFGAVLEFSVTLEFASFPGGCPPFFLLFTDSGVVLLDTRFMEQI